MKTLTPARLCWNYRQNERGELVRCTRPGTPRSDNGLAAGRYCDECWKKVAAEARSQSW